MNIQNDNIYNPNYKIGIKELTNNQLIEGLPNFSELIKRIETIRQESVSVDKESLEGNIFESLKYDNIFSILGGRGAGKTSVLYTLYKYFKNDVRNIMVPIVMPELLYKNENIISWVLSAVESCLGEIENMLKSNNNLNNNEDSYKTMCEKYKFFDRCVFNNNNVLRKKYNDLKQVFYDNENKIFGQNYSENSELMANSVKSGFEIIPKFIGF